MPTHNYTLNLTTQGSGSFQQLVSVNDVQARTVSQTCASASPTAYTIDVDFNGAGSLTIQSLVMSSSLGTITVTPYSEADLGGSAGTPVSVVAGTLSLFAPTAGIGTVSTCPLGATAIQSLKVIADTAGAVFKLDAIVTATNG